MNFSRFLVLGLVLTGGAAGCASTPSSDAPRSSAEVPDDFSVDITILTEEDGVGAETRNARYVLFPDGSLRYAAKPGRGPNTLPPVVRRLSRRQVEMVWQRARQLGLTDRTQADEPTNFRRVWTPRDGHIYLVAMTGDDHYWNFTRRVDSDEELDPALRAFIRDLGALAWAKDDPSVTRTVPPRRFDYGPDPYAVYRQNARDLANSDSESETSDVTP